MLALRGLEFSWSGATRLRFADAELAQAECALLMGPSGSGKSTLLALIAGLLTPTAGRLVVGGTDIASLPRWSLDAWRGATVGFVPQRMHLSDSLSVAENLALPYIACGTAVDHPRIAALLDRLGLAGLSARRPHQLSGGQAQRVALARALLRQPRLLLADEPTAHLDDSASQEAIELLVQSARASGATLLVATHDARIRRHLPSARVLTLPTAS